MTARALCDLPEPPTSDLVLGPLLVRGQRLLLAGPTGHGKTTLLLEILSSVVKGEPFLDWTGCGGRALVIDAEQGLRTIKRRLREAGLHESDDVDYLRVPDGLALDSDTEEVAGIERLLSRGDYTMVIGDPIYKLHRGDSNAEREAVDLMRHFDRWRDEYHFALVLAAHCRKPPPGGKFTMHEIFGSTAYLRGAEVVLGLERPRNGYAKLHFFKDRDGDLPVGDAWGLLFERGDGFRRDPDDGKPKHTAKDAIRELLAESPGLTQAELAQSSGYAERTIRDALTALKKDGTLSDPVKGPHGINRWALAEHESAAQLAVSLPSD